MLFRVRDTTCFHGTTNGNWSRRQHYHVGGEISGHIGKILRRVVEIFWMRRRNPWKRRRNIFWTRRRRCGCLGNTRLDASAKLPHVSKVSRRRDYFIVDASASRVGYAADAIRNPANYFYAISSLKAIQSRRSALSST